MEPGNITGSVLLSVLTGVMSNCKEPSCHRVTLLLIIALCPKQTSISSVWTAAVGVMYVANAAFLVILMILLLTPSIISQFASLDRWLNRYSTRNPSAFVLFTPYLCCLIIMYNINIWWYTWYNNVFGNFSGFSRITRVEYWMHKFLRVQSGNRSIVKKGNYKFLMLYFFVKHRSPVSLKQLMYHGCFYVRPQGRRQDGLPPAIWKIWRHMLRSCKKKTKSFAFGARNR